jgi:hypothetical protein
VSAANKAEKFDGGNFLTRWIQLNNFFHFNGTLFQDFTCAEVFTRLARSHFETFLAEARGLTHPLARTKALVTLCDAVF